MTEQAQEFRMPSLGADMAAGRLLQWLRAPGDQLKRGDIIAEVDTDKGVIEIEVFTEGTLSKLLVQEGERVPVGTVLALIAASGAGEAQVAVSPPAAPPAPITAVAPAPVPGPPEKPRSVRASPVAKRFAAERGIDLADVTGTGPEGVITLADVESVTATAAATQAGEEGVGRLRQAIAAAMSRSKREIPHYYLMTVMDLGPAVSWLSERNRGRPPAERLILGVLQLKAVALALREFPDLNGWWVDGRPVPGRGIHVGMAVALRGGGVVAPAIRDTDQLSLGDLMAAARSLVDRVRGGKLRSSELSDATITVTSLGERGVDAVVGVIQPPQVALVGFGRPTRRPWVVENQVVARDVVTASLSGDHRASDGHRGALFLARVEELLQDPGKL
jgi:pyruvate dehydrogenase E2 component (dihydrolipoamide acetyltransferase)